MNKNLCCVLDIISVIHEAKGHRLERPPEAVELTSEAIQPQQPSSLLQLVEFLRNYQVKPEHPHGFREAFDFVNSPARLNFVTVLCFHYRFNAGCRWTLDKNKISFCWTLDLSGICTNRYVVKKIIFFRSSLIFFPFLKYLFNITAGFSAA